MEKKRTNQYVFHPGGLAVWIAAFCMALALLMLPGSPALVSASATTWTFEPIEGPRAEYDLDEKEVTIILSGSGLGYEDYMKMFDKVTFESSDTDVVTIDTAYNNLGIHCIASTVSFGKVTITAKKGDTVLGTYSYSIKPDDLKLNKEYSTLVYDDSFKEPCGYLSFNERHPIVSAKSSDESVCMTGLKTHGLNEYGEKEDGRDVGAEDCRCIVYPMGPGKATITVKDSLGMTAKVDVTVKKSWFSSWFKQKGIGYFQYFIFPHPDATEPDEHLVKNLYYGTTTVTVSARYGTKVTLKVGKKTYKTVTANEYGQAVFKKVKLAKLKTKVTVTSKLGGEKKTIRGKVVSKSDIIPVTIKPRSKKGEVMLKRASKGDVIKITSKGKTLLKKKIKKAENFPNITFKSKKRLKKNQKIKYTLYNKFGQKLASGTYRVGAYAEW